jgi:hypothetical protein
MCDCTSENLEIPGLVLTRHPGNDGALDRFAAIEIPMAVRFALVRGSER